MPRAFDRGVPPQDHNPLFGLLDFNNIDDVVQLVGGSIWDFITGIRDGIVDFIYELTGINLASWDAFIASLVDGKGIDLPWVVEGLQWLLGVFENLFNGLNLGDIPTPGEFWEGIAQNILNPLGALTTGAIDGLQGMLDSLNDWITDIIVGIGNVLDDIPIVGRDLEAALLRLFNVRQKAVTADTRSSQIVEDVQAGWSGGTPSGTPTAVFETIESIRAAVAGGYTLQTFTASNTAWAVPPELALAAEAYAGVIGGGGRGGGGGAVVTQDDGVLRTGGPGGSSGGYIVQQFDATTLGATLNITVGAAAASVNTDGGITSIVNGATTLAVSTPNGGGIATVQGFVTTTSTPGAGGQGGNATTNSSATAGTAGQSSAVATGGVGGSNSGGSGGAGGAGSTSGLPLCGGGGGGGGGGRVLSGGFVNSVGGNGGNGGYPGGGGGGGGAAVAQGLGATASGGSAGTPGNGFAFLLWK